MIKIDISSEVREKIDNNHKEYIINKTSLKLENEISKMPDCKNKDFYFKLFGDSEDSRKKMLLKYCLCRNFDELIKGFNEVFYEVFLFEFSDDSNEGYKKIIDSIKSDLSKILDYKGFNYGTLLLDGNKWNRHEYISLLNIKVCPYCNRQYITSYVSEDNDNRTTSDADHYYPKAIYPILQMNIYNLIPSCNVCNSKTKGVSDIRHLYPLIDDSDSMIFKIDYSLEKDKCKIMIEDKGNDKTKGSINVFKLDKIYQSHIEDALEVKESAENFFCHKEEMYKKLMGLDVPSEVFSLMFNYLGKEALKEPLTKLKNDIYFQIKSKYES